MPRYFIDLHTGAEHVRDTEGFELPDLDAVRGKLMRILISVMHELSPEAERQDFTAAVRDGTGAVLLRARLSLTLERAE